MKKLAAGLLCLSVFTIGAFGQGLVSFFPTVSTLSSVNLLYSGGMGVQTTSGPPGSYYYALLISSTPTGPFTFSGVYATNLSVAGYFGSPAGVQVPGWLPGTSMSYEVAMWSANEGAVWNAAWLLQNNTVVGPTGWVPGGYAGLSSVATGVSGGAGIPASPPLPLFGGATGIQSGFIAEPVTIPEPSVVALACLSSAALLCSRRGSNHLKPNPC